MKNSLHKIIHPFRKWWTFKTATVVKNKTESHASTSGKYVLTIDSLDMGKGFWHCTRGTVKTKSGKKIAVVDRNYSSFPFAFVEHHPDGHDYLICGENYQGQTIIQLDTGKRVDYLPDSASKGLGFCWASVHPSPDGLLLAVEGCYWGAPYELVFIDFSKPMMLPFPEIDRNDVYEEFISWESPTEAKICRRFEVSVKYGKPEHELTSEELDDVYKENQEAVSDEEYEKIWKEIVDEITWRRP